MKCFLCSKAALRIGTQGRGYCNDHADQAWSQVAESAKRLAAAREMISENQRLEFIRERHLRAI